MKSPCQAISEGASLSDRLFAQLREAIIVGKLVPGEKISEPELARAFGSSRGPLREAIARLESIGLVERKPNIGARVVTLNKEQLIEIFYVREALESAAARQAAERMSETEIAQLHTLLKQHSAQINASSDHSYFQKEGDLDFHYRIVQGSKNRFLIKLLCNDLYHLVRLYRFQFGMTSKRAPRAFSEHQQIIDAIERRDGEMAELLMRAHIRASRENAQRLLAD